MVESFFHMDQNTPYLFINNDGICTVIELLNNRFATLSILINCKPGAVARQDLISIFDQCTVYKLEKCFVDNFSHGEEVVLVPVNPTCAFQLVRIVKFVDYTVDGKLYIDVKSHRVEVDASNYTLFKMKV